MVTLFRGILRLPRLDGIRLNAPELVKIPILSGVMAEKRAWIKPEIRSVKLECNERVCDEIRLMQRVVDVARGRSARPESMDWETDLVEMRERCA